MNLLPFPKNILEDSNITNPNSEYLVQIGLSEFCAPHLYFGDFEGHYLPLLKDWPWHDQWAEGYKAARTNYESALILGTAANNEPIVLLPGRSEVFVFDSVGEKLLFLNSDVHTLGLVLAAFEDFVEQAVTSRQNSVVEKRVSAGLIDAFLDKLHDLESTKSHWNVWAKQLGENSEGND